MIPSTQPHRRVAPDGYSSDDGAKQIGEKYQLEIRRIAGERCALEQEMRHVEIEQANDHDQHGAERFGSVRDRT
jgi:hypothetical protein